MKTDIELICGCCGKNFFYAKKEYKRQTTKFNRSIFFCSIHCGTKHNNKHRSKETQDKMNIALSKRSIGNEYNKKGDFTYYIRKAYGRDKDKQRESNLDENHLQSIWNGRCALSGIEIHLKKGKHVLNTASLDRIDSKEGYVKGNVQFVAYALNLAKNNFSDEDVIKFIAEIKAIP